MRRGAQKIQKVQEKLKDHHGGAKIPKIAKKIQTVQENQKYRHGGAKIAKEVRKDSKDRAGKGTDRRGAISTQSDLTGLDVQHNLLTVLFVLLLSILCP